jgi:hypothetical protein
MEMEGLVVGKENVKKNGWRKIIIVHMEKGIIVTKSNCDMYNCWLGEIAAK